jgi:hypothetical protein
MPPPPAPSPAGRCAGCGRAAAGRSLVRLPQPSKAARSGGALVAPGSFRAVGLAYGESQARPEATGRIPWTGRRCDVTARTSDRSACSRCRRSPLGPSGAQRPHSGIEVARLSGRRPLAPTGAMAAPHRRRRPHWSSPRRGTSTSPAASERHLQLRRSSNRCVQPAPSVLAQLGPDFHLEPDRHVWPVPQAAPRPLRSSQPAHRPRP